MATSSQFNRPYAMNTLTQAQGGAPSQFNQLQASPFGSNSLANRAPVPVGRSMNDINRIAEQQRRRGNFRPMIQLGMMDKQQQFYNTQNDKNFDQSKQMFGMQQQAMDARDQTQRGWQQQDWQRNQTEAQRMEDARRQWEMTQYGIKLGDQAMEQERQRQQAELDRRNNSFAAPMTMNDPNGKFMIPGYQTKGGDFRPAGGAYPVTPQAPGFEMKQDATGAFRQFYGGKPLGSVTYQGAPVPGSFVRRSTEGQPTPMQYTPIMPPPTERVTEGADGGVSRTYTQPRGAAPSAPASPAAAGGAYFDNLLKPPAAPAGAPTAMVTGQMPNVAYANDLSPEQSLAAAREDYARTGNDAALKQHFQNFPSQAVQYGQQEQQLWQQIGQMPTDTRQQIEQSMTKMREADRLNAQGQAAAKGMPIPANYAVDPDRRPLLPPVRPYVAPQEDPFLVQSWQGAQSFAQDAGAAIKQGVQNLAAYGRKNPLIVLKR